MLYIYLTMTPINDPLIQKMILRKNLSRSRIRSYEIILNGYCGVTQLSPTELIREAKEDQQPYIGKNNQIIFPSVEERKITTYLYQYYSDLKKKNTAPASIKNYIAAIRAFYREYHIELPRNIEITVPKPIIREGDIPTIEDIRLVVESTNNIKNKALILLMASSGMRKGDILNFKVSDFTAATKEYHNSDSVDDLLDGKYKNVIPSWYFTPSKTKKRGNVCITFNSPEASEYIIRHLNSRDGVSESDPLFVTRIGPLTQGGLISTFRGLNDSLFGRKSNGDRFFKAHSLRKFFLSTFRKHSNNSFALKLFAGHSLPSKIDNHYQELSTKDFKKVYLPILPFVTIRDTEVRVIEEDELNRLKQKIRSMELEQDKLRAELATAQWAFK